jgi:hypothetical protein
MGVVVELLKEDHFLAFDPEADASPFEDLHDFGQVTFPADDAGE